MSQDYLFTLKSRFIALKIRLSISPLEKEKFAAKEMKKLYKAMLLRHRQGKSVDLEIVDQKIDKRLREIKESDSYNSKRRYYQQPKDEPVVKEHGMHGDFYGARVDEEEKI